MRDGVGGRKESELDVCVLACGMEPWMFDYLFFFKVYCFCLCHEI